jgi:hypothetical protein
MRPQGVAMVRNETHAIEAFDRHHLAPLDEPAVADDRSGNLAKLQAERLSLRCMPIAACGFRCAR